MEMSASRPIVVYAPSFEETQGGVVVLHYLVDRLRSIGREAYLYPARSNHRIFPTDDVSFGRRVINRSWNRALDAKAARTFKTHETMDVSLVPRRLLRNAVVVYPETTNGNPLKSPRVVRWLLHKPGYFFPDAKLGEDELTFFYQEVFAEGLADIDPQNMLRFRWIREDIYMDRNLAEREGACRMLREQKVGPQTLPPGDKAEIIDHYDPKQIADAFNRREVFYCHDPYTMYLFYAALCGCIPVIVPPSGMTESEWRPKEEDRFGVAFGEERIPWAQQTRRALIKKFLDERESEMNIIRAFADKVDERYPD